MKKNLFAMAIAIALFASCAKSDVDELSFDGMTEDFIATLATETRTELDGNAVVWNDDDLLTIFTKTAHNRKYQIKSLTSDGRTATFGYVGFTGSDNTKITSNYTVYPYDAEATISNGIITTSLQSVQTYSGESKNLRYALMAAKSDDNNFAFQNVGALLRFSVTKIIPDDLVLNEIKISSAENKIAGEINIDLNSDTCTSTISDNGVNEIILSAINTEITTGIHSFYVAMPALAFADKDLTVTFSFADGVKSFALPAFELESGKIKTISYSVSDAEDFTGTTPTAVSKPAKNQIWYTSTDNNIVTPNDVFGVAIESNEYNAEKECFVITFSENITSIANMAFEGCSTLKTITIPEGVEIIEHEAFLSCTSLTDVAIPNSVTEIWREAFCRTSLTSVTIPNNVTNIGDGVFADCEFINSFYGKFASEDNRCLIIDGRLVAFAPSGVEKYTIPNNVTEIGNYVFAYNESLREITIPDSVVSIGDMAFYSCYYLVNTTIGKGVESIGDEAFTGCTGELTINSKAIVETDYMIGSNSPLLKDSKFSRIIIGDNITKIGDGVFSNYSTVLRVDIPSTVISIGQGAFMSCRAIQSITIPNSVSEIYSLAFAGMHYMTSITIPESVSEIGEQVFYGCTSLRSFNGKYASEDNRCLVVDGKLIAFAPSELTTYTIPQGVSEIGYGTFSGCVSLTDVTIPSSVTSIEEEAFMDCSALATIRCEAIEPPKGANAMFANNAEARVIQVPAASLDKYISAPYWSEHTSAIEGY